MDTSKISSIVNQNSVVLVIEGKVYNISSRHAKFDEIVEAVESQDWEVVLDLADIHRKVAKFCDGKLEISGSSLTWKGNKVDNSLTRRILKMANQDQNVDSLIVFLEKLMTNPSYTAVNELYGFMEYGDLPITPEGDFLAYKKIRGDWTDIYTGKISNKIGNEIFMDRNAVDDDRNRTCSKGLHFCSQDYLPYFGSDEWGKDAETNENGDPQSRVVIVSINPADVVSIPSDYNNTKGRTCRYTVIAELEEWVDLTEESVNTSYSAPVQVIEVDADNPELIEED